MRTAFCILIFLLSTIGQAASFDVDSAYRQLDEAIRQSPQFVQKKQDKIGQLISMLATSSDNTMRFQLSHQLYEQYLAFVNDSAIYYLEQCINIAKAMDNQALEGKVRAELAFQCSNTGMYDEALFTLDSIKPALLERDGLGAYYKACNHVYGEMAFYTRFEPLRERYRKKAADYEQLLYEVLDSTDLRLFQRQEMTWMDKGDLDKSLAINDKWMENVPHGSHAYALTTFYRYLEFKQRNDTTQMMYWLTESAVSDVRNAVMDQGSMWELANLLMAQGNIDRAYKYISFASDCATHFGTRLRFWQLSPILSAIDNKYRDYHEQEKQRTRIFMIILGLLTVVLALLLYNAIRQHKRLSIAHAQVHEKNELLTALNAQLSSLNEQLSTANNYLSESNSVKEEYVGHFMRLCSMYVDKIDNFRKRVNKMVKNRDYDELYQLTRGQEFREKELDDLYASFDTAFLHLFPDFVEEFNALLRPEERITIDEKDRLNTSIRIFALIRLGIDDSSKIADFLHYSVNTIYNYRAKIKNGALHDRDTFEQRVKGIGNLPLKH